MGSGGSVIKAAAYIENDHVIPFHNEEHAEEIKTTKRSFFHKTKKRNLQPEIISSGNPQLKADCEVIPVKQNDTLNSKGFDCRKIEVSKRQAQPESQMTSSQGRKTLNSPTSSEKHFFTSSDVQKTRKAKVEKPKPIKNGGLPPVLMGNATASENKQVSNIKIPVRNASALPIQAQNNHSAMQLDSISLVNKTSTSSSEQVVKAPPQGVHHTPAWLDESDESMMDEILDTTVAW